MTCALPEGYRPMGKWIQAIHDLWGETWVPRMDFGLKARVEKEDRLQLDAEQFAVLRGLMENESVLVTGAAGFAYLFYGAPGALTVVPGWRREYGSLGSAAICLGLAPSLRKGGKGRGHGCILTGRVAGCRGRGPGGAEAPI